MVQAGQVTQATKDKEAIIIQGAVNPGPDLSRDLRSLGLVACCKGGGVKRGVAVGFDAKLSLHHFLVYKTAICLLYLPTMKDKGNGAGGGLLLTAWSEAGVGGTPEERLL